MQFNRLLISSSNTARAIRVKDFLDYKISLDIPIIVPRRSRHVPGMWGAIRHQLCIAGIRRVPLNQNGRQVPTFGARVF